MSQIQIPVLQPYMKVINRQQALAIHSAALEVLEMIGVKMDHREVRRMLLDGRMQGRQGRLGPYFFFSR